MTETLPSKRHSEIVFRCAACGCLDSSERTHTTTCSNRCRTWLHRHPEHIADLADICERQNISLALVLQAQAIQELMPTEYSERIRDGHLEIEDTRADVYRVFIERVFQIVARNSSDEASRREA